MPSEPADQDIQRGLPVDWALAARTASKLMAPGPTVSRAEAQRTVELLRNDAATAEGHVRDLTGLGAGLPLLPADVVDRPSWAVAATSGMAVLTSGARLPAVPNLARRFTSGTAGLQAGAVLAYLGSRVLGQYDPFGGADGQGKLLLVAPNVVAAQQVLDVSLDDFAMWVCLHEATHRLQFTAVPWLRDYFAEQVTDFLSVNEQTAAGILERLPDAISSMRGSKDGLGLIELLQGPEQRLMLDRLLALTTLLEGHADHVMDAVGPTVVPSVSTIRARFSARRRGGGLLDRILRAVLGVEAKVRQYAVGSAFTNAVVSEVGMERFNQVWTSPETLPTRAELPDAPAWIRRVT
ncbi:zinc-dependent metalloprotease [Pseudonocardia spinosispora]|uniref:zinc-dependent metalloprotease n=1 Tax=Pseudonocardia spinosispora TaxID=103441 RepID=UPI001FDEFF44|nr:zinc-dependent metalloprotease [Pseudonocardia spinosispora]